MRLVDIQEIKLFPNKGKIDMDVMKVHRMKFIWDSPVFLKMHVQFALFYNITFLSLQSIMVLAKEEAWWNTLFSPPFFPVVSQSPANGILERGLLYDKGFIDLFWKLFCHKQANPVLIVLLSETELWLPQDTWLLHGEF